MTSRPRRLILVRHAQGSLGSSNYDQLSDTGYRQAEIVGARLAAAVSDAEVVRGELQRHRQTADCLDCHGPSRIDGDLNEYRVDYLLQAAFERADELGLQRPGDDALADPVSYLDTFLALFPHVLQAWQERRIECEFNGLWSAFNDRVTAAAQRLAEALGRTETVIAVTSAGVISTMAARLLGHDLGWQRSLNVSLYNASVTELRMQPAGGWEAGRINCVDHLHRDDLRTLA